MVAQSWTDQPIIPPILFLPSLVYRLGSLALKSLLFGLFVIVLTLTDLVYFLANLIFPLIPRGAATAPAFSPTNPPNPFHLPFAWLLCLAAHFLGSKSPEWLIGS